MIIVIEQRTANSLIAIWRDARVRLVSTAPGKRLMPSCVRLDNDNSMRAGAMGEYPPRHPGVPNSLSEKSPY